MKTITLYHGSAEKIDSFRDNVPCGGLYLSPEIAVANEYLVCQADHATGSYGFIYKVEIPVSDIVATDDIDQEEKCTGVLFSEEDNYYRIDLCSRYNIVEMSDAEICGAMSISKL